MSWLFFWRRRIRERRQLSARERELAETVPFMVRKDEREVRRLNEQHFAIRQELGGNFGAPLTMPTDILDIGCGTGRWVMEMATAFPAARVIGIDIVAPNPAESLGLGINVIPPNVAFRQVDATQPLPFPDASFDYVHLCLLYAVIPAAAWNTLIGECVRATRVGGWIESVEALPLSNTTEHRDMVTLTTWFCDLLRFRGAEPLVAAKMPRWLREHGLSHIVTRDISDQAQKGDQQEAIMELEALIEYIRAPVVEAGITTAEAFENVAATALREVRYSSQGSGFNTYDTFGQRVVE
jgi:ubiquinone/menaquinone biosynthesis C-methylase UbiE